MNNSKPFGNAPKEVLKIDPATNEVIARYPSVTEAGKSIDNVNARVSITFCCQGKQKHAFGYSWKYAD